MHFTTIVTVPPRWCHTWLDVWLQSSLVLCLLARGGKAHGRDDLPRNLLSCLVEYYSTLVLNTFCFLKRGEKVGKWGSPYTMFLRNSKYSRSEQLRLPLPAVTVNLVSVIFFWKPSPLDFPGAIRYSPMACLSCTIILSRIILASSNRWPSGRLFRCEFGKTHSQQQTAILSRSCPHLKLQSVILASSCYFILASPFRTCQTNAPAPVPAAHKSSRSVQVLHNFIAGAS